MAQAPARLGGLGRGLGAGMTALWPGLHNDVRESRKAQAFTECVTAIGWVGGVFGLRVQDYRRVTSESGVNGSPEIACA